MTQTGFRAFADRLRQNGFKEIPHSSFHFSPITCISQKDSSGRITHIPSLATFVKPNSMNPLIEVDIWKNGDGGFSVRVNSNWKGREGYWLVVFDENGNIKMGDATTMERILSLHKT